MKKRAIAVFDFDGTLTEKDTLIEFVKFACGVSACVGGFLRYFPYVLLMKMNLYPNWKIKEKLFRFFFQGWFYSDFVRCCEEFSNRIKTFERKSILSLLEKHVKKKDMVIPIYVKK